MNTYELLYMVPPALAENEVGDVSANIQKMVVTIGGKVVKENRWGVRRLAYPIDNFHQAHYVLLDLEMEPAMVDQLEQRLRREATVLRHIVTATRPKTEKELEAGRRLARRLVEAQAEQLTSRVETVPAIVASGTIPASQSGGPAIFSTPSKSAPLQDDITGLEKEGERAKAEAAKDPGFLQESGKKKADADLDDLDKKIDEILEDTML